MPGDYQGILSAFLSGNPFFAILGFLLFFGAVATFLEGLKRLRWSWASVFGGRLHEGAMVSVEGKLRATLGNQLFHTPLTDTPCLAYCLRIFAIRSSNPRGGHARALLYEDCRGLQQLSLESVFGIHKLMVSDFDRERDAFQDSQDLLGKFSHPRSQAFIEALGISPNLAGLRRSLAICESIFKDGEPVRVIARIENGPEGFQLVNALITEKSQRRYLLEAFLILFGALLFGFFAVALLLKGFGL
jgi:hypothetical protein